MILASRETGRTILSAAQARGEIAAPLDMEALLDMIYGPLFYRLLVGHCPLDEGFAEAIIGTAFRALASIDAEIAAAKLDLGAVFTNEFVKKANAKYPKG